MNRNTQPLADPAEQMRALGYVDERAICSLLGISLPTLRDRLSEGTAPPPYKVSARHLFKTSELDAWIRRRRVNKAAA